MSYIHGVEVQSYHIEDQIWLRCHRQIRWCDAILSYCQKDSFSFRLARLRRTWQQKNKYIYIFIIIIIMKLPILHSYYDLLKESIKISFRGTKDRYAMPLRHRWVLSLVPSTLTLKTTE